MRVLGEQWAADRQAQMFVSSLLHIKKSKQERAGSTVT